MADSTETPTEQHARVPSAKQLRARLAALKNKVKSAEAQLRQAEAIEKERERKRDTRRKIILGGDLLRQAGEGDLDARRVIERALTHLPEREKPLFEGWRPPGPERGDDASAEPSDGD